ncbi:MAG TPA: cyanophycinase [Chitinophagaceae bacterium]|nr:cyanophycinase [Chitinophagaceae bacterium]
MTPRGTLLIIGGGEDKGDNNGPDIQRKNKEFENFEILKELLRVNHGKRRIEMITTASAVPDEIEKMYRDAFKKIGFKDLGFIKIENKIEARNPEFQQRIEDAHAVFFTGGDQFKLSAILGGTPCVETIKEKYQHDKDFVVAGTSAGAMVMPSIMIYEGGVREALLKNDLKITAGLGIFDTCIVDTHFIKRGRFGRLAHAIVMNPEALGIGLGEDTVMIVKNGFDAECRGSGMVVIIDGKEIEQTNIIEAEEDTPIYVENLKVHLLSKGSRFSIKERKMQVQKKRERVK